MRRLHLDQIHLNQIHLNQIQRFLIGSVAFSFVLAACASLEPGPTSARPRIVVTTEIWSDIVSNLACDQDVTIDTLIPSGANLHGFEVSLKDRTEIGKADLLIANGLGLEERLASTIRSAEQDGVSTMFIGDEVSSLVDSVRLSREGDPHIWLDPAVVIQALPSIKEQLIKKAGLDAQRIQDCTQRYRAKLIQLDSAIGQTINNIPDGRRKLVTNHDSLGYFADRYNLEIIGTVLPSTSSLAEASPASLERLAGLVTQFQIPVIFSESAQANKDAQALADRLGVEIVPLRPASLGPAGSGQDTYLTWLLALAERIAGSLISESS